MNTFHTSRFAPVGALLVLVALAGGTRAQFENGSFETGDFSGWITKDMASPHYTLTVGGAGLTDGLVPFQSQPTHGAWAAVHGFDGGGPDTIELAQDVTIPKATPLLLFDYAGSWDLLNWSATILDRHFTVIVEQAGGGDVLRTLAVRTAHGSTVESTGHVTAGIDLGEFAGETIRVRFLWEVPQAFTGPAMFQLDHVRLEGRKVDPLDDGSLSLKLDFDQQFKDQLQLALVVPVQPGFLPTGQPIRVTVGNVVHDLVLDHKGNAAGMHASVRVRALKSHPGYQQLRLRVKGGNLLAGLAPHGLGNIDTPANGITVALPVSVELDGLLTDLATLVVYRATLNATGKARGKPAPERMDTRLAIRLDFDKPDHDALLLRSVAPIQPGFLPEGRVLALEIGSTDWAFTLDKDGRGENPVAQVWVQRDHRNPALCSVVLECKQGSLAAQLAGDGLINASVPKPGEALQFPLRITLDAPICQPVFEVVYSAKFNKAGKAKGSL